MTIQNGFDMPDPIIFDRLEKVFPDTDKLHDPQESALESLAPCEILEIHDDGDLTVRCQDSLYVVTAEGRIFREVGRNA